MTNISKGDRVTSMAISGGFAEFATVSADAIIQIPPSLTFAEATIPLQGMTAYTMFKYGVISSEPKSILI